MSAALAVSDIHHEVSDGSAVKRTLSPLTRRFEPGAFHVFGGPSGAGKTTLLSLLSLAVRAAGGRIFHGGSELTALSAREAGAWRRTHLGMVFQTTRLVAIMTAQEHIALASRLRPHAPGAFEKGMALLFTLGLADQLHQLPGQLSGGEKQRIALAQALCFAPSIVLCDEPTAALDGANARLIGEILADYAHDQNAVVICASHDRALHELADHSFDLERP